MFNCEICKYKSNRKQNLERHLLSNRHKNMSKVLKIKTDAQNEQQMSKKYLQLFNDDIFYKIILGKKEIINTSCENEILNIKFLHNTTCSLDITILISNIDNTNMKVENYTCNIIFNKSKNIKHANIHQINTFQSEICDNNTFFIKDFSTNIESIFINDNIILLKYKYNLYKTDNQTKLFINYNIKYTGNNNIEFM